LFADKLPRTVAGKPAAIEKAAGEERTEPLVRHFMPELDTLRGIAVLGVLFFHGFRAEYSELPFTGVARGLVLATQAGALGVNLFFVLSGFLITGILLDSRSMPDYYWRFYARRALRILPAFYSLLILLALLHQASAAFLGLSFVYLSNFTGAFGVSMDYHPLWSLAVEEHYYILWPTAVRKLRVRPLAIFSLALFILIPIARAISFHYGYFEGRDWYTWFSADGLAEGSLLAIFLRSSISRKRVSAGSMLLLALVPILAKTGAPFGILTRQSLLGAALQSTLVNTFFLGLLLLFLLLGSSSRKQLVNSSVLQFIGYISYGLYLVHPMIFRVYDRMTWRFWPWMQPSVGHFGLIVIRFGVGATVAVGLSYISRKYYEGWFLRLKERLAPAPGQAAIMVALAPTSKPAAAGESLESLKL
jgi:peptidoglycan/LPS O-acetylase OafA/YrhL